MTWDSSFNCSELSSPVKWGQEKQATRGDHVAETIHETGHGTGPRHSVQQVLPGRFHTIRSISGLCVRPHKPVVSLGTQRFTYPPSAQPPEPAGFATSKLYCYSFLPAIPFCVFSKDPVKRDNLLCVWKVQDPPGISEDVLAAWSCLSGRTPALHVDGPLL